MKVTEIIKRLSRANRLHGGYRQLLAKMDRDHENFDDIVASMEDHAKKIARYEGMLVDLGLLDELDKYS